MAHLVNLPQFQMLAKQDESCQLLLEDMYTRFFGLLESSSELPEDVYILESKKIIKQKSDAEEKILREWYLEQISN